MFDEPNESPAERAGSAGERAREKGDEFRMHAELFAVFEGCRKFGAGIYAGLEAGVAREIQRGFGKLEKGKSAESPVLPGELGGEAVGLLNSWKTRGLSRNDYHVHRRPGEAMMVRWLAGEEVETFYERLQAHFDAVMEGFREDERQALEWKKDPENEAYLKALDGVKVNMAERYLREPIKEHGIFVLSTQTADEINIAYLADYVMGAPAAEIVGGKSAPAAEASEGELAWFYKLFSLRGMVEGAEGMCFFMFLQKTGEGDGGEG